MEIEIKLPRWFSDGDEDYFFAWLKSVDQVKHYAGGPRGLVVTLAEPVDDPNLRELIGLMRRYDLDMKWLRQLRTKENEKWFASETKDWHQSVFKD